MQISIIKISFLGSQLQTQCDIFSAISIIVDPLLQSSLVGSIDVLPDLKDLHYWHILERCDNPIWVTYYFVYFTVNISSKGETFFLWQYSEFRWKLRILCRKMFLSRRKAKKKTKKLINRLFSSWVFLSSCHSSMFVFVAQTYFSVH